MELAQSIDDLSATEVLVFGSLPPHGRDLDLLVRDERDATALKKALAQRGFVTRGSSLVRFSNGSVEGVDVVMAAEWRLPKAERRALFSEALPIGDFAHLVRPSPRHALLILARRFARSGPHLADKHRARIATVLREDPDAWTKATAGARSWGASRSLDLLHSAHVDRTTPTRRELIAALTEEYRSQDRTGAYLRAVRRGVKPRSGAIVALSGLDGAGKTTQAEALKEALTKLGFDAVVEWTKIARNPSLDIVAAPVKFLLRRPKRPASSEQPASDGLSDAKRLRERSALVTHAWTVVVAVTNAAAHRKATRQHLRNGRIVICDRYVLDSAAHMRYRYGPQHRFRLQRALVRRLSPKPLQQFLLHLPPEEALARKAEQYDLKQLTQLARLYSEERDALGIREVNATEPADELNARIAQDVWERLTE